MAGVTHGNRIIQDMTFKIGLYGVTKFASDTFIYPDAGDTVTYTAAGMPGGVQFYGVGQQFYGTPYAADVPGDYKVTVGATSSDGSKDQLTFTLHLAGATSGFAPIYPATTNIDPAPYTVGSNAAIGTPITGTPNPLTASDVDGNLGTAPYHIAWDNVSGTYGSSYKMLNGAFEPLMLTGGLVR